MSLLDAYKADLLVEFMDCYRFAREGTSDELHKELGEDARLVYLVEAACMTICSHLDGLDCGCDYEPER